jgi:DNA-binding GntR family transcriptional regulator
MQGKGTFVATHTEEKASLFRFLRIRRNDGRSAAAVGFASCRPAVGPNEAAA